MSLECDFNFSNGSGSEKDLCLSKQFRPGRQYEMNTLGRWRSQTQCLNKTAFKNANKDVFHGKNINHSNLIALYLKFCSHCFDN